MTMMRGPPWGIATSRSRMEHGAVLRFLLHFPTNREKEHPAAPKRYFDPKIIFRVIRLRVIFLFFRSPGYFQETL